MWITSNGFLVFGFPVLLERREGKAAAWLKLKAVVVLGSGGPGVSAVNKARFRSRGLSWLVFNFVLLSVNKGRGEWCGGPFSTLY
uniref:Uncharacterized protein n=1 Tax=Utricularia reniformis TaxID=192314 RepID=A0A1Y0B480_9LAMI|nr:hypothetical protein AEK19_MT2035 [Utricularia reniformis]ART32194.1 hypothetical protein AEK19_MT2035 [Utricularia reniformis]